MNKKATIRCRPFTGIPSSLIPYNTIGVLANDFNGGLFAYLIPKLAPQAVSLLIEHAGDSHEKVKKGDASFTPYSAWDKYDVDEMRSMAKNGKLNVIFRGDEPIGYIEKDNKFSPLLLKLLRKLKKELEYVSD